MGCWALLIAPSLLRVLCGGLIDAMWRYRMKESCSILSVYWVMSAWVACLSLSQKWFLEKSLAKKKSRWRVAPGFASRGFDPRPERDIWGSEPWFGTRWHQFLSIIDAISSEYAHGLSNECDSKNSQQVSIP
jgi:hypothetical protein